ncbi:MAG: sporulation initiation factor Spo0A C-terminal domain-containing protein [Lawsonibacter sp.]|nr:sporulation initiation factor Spo0A C-terminal domain-containing protein [Lawsonibacter sp.]
METTYFLSENYSTCRTLAKKADFILSQKSFHPKTDCHLALKKLGITPNYIGFHQILSAVEFVNREPDALFSVTKTLYPTIAKEYGTNWKAVERNIRSIVSMAWERNPALVRDIAGYPLKTKPKAAQFIAMLVNTG